MKIETVPFKNGHLKEQRDAIQRYFDVYIKYSEGCVSTRHKTTQNSSFFRYGILAF